MARDGDAVDIILYVLLALLLILIIAVLIVAIAPGTNKEMDTLRRYPDQPTNRNSLTTVDVLIAYTYIHPTNPDKYPEPARIQAFVTNVLTISTDLPASTPWEIIVRELATDIFNSEETFGVSAQIFTSATETFEYTIGNIRPLRKDQF